MFLGQSFVNVRTMLCICTYLKNYKNIQDFEFIQKILSLTYSDGF